MAQLLDMSQALNLLICGVYYPFDGEREATRGPLCIETLFLPGTHRLNAVARACPQGTWGGS